MSNEPALPAMAKPGGPLIPTPPPGGGKRRKRRQRPADLRWLLWAGALALGIGMGISAYQWLPGVDSLFDYWVALALS